MSISYIPEAIKRQLWAKSAGRCEYCNTRLYIDSLTKAEFNAAYIAHIVADKPAGPRGDPVLSEKLKSDPSNLMLLCDAHHRLIDIKDVAGHSVACLQEMKQKHEQRIELVTSLTEDKQTHIVLYGANIGLQTALVSWDMAASAVLPDRYPAEKPAIVFSLQNSSFYDHEADFWQIERKNLQRQFEQKIKQNLVGKRITHFSVFALAPQPLLIELGRLLTDLTFAEVFQKHREPETWDWLDDDNEFPDYLVSKPENCECKTVALKLSLSANIENPRVTKVLGDGVSIWEISVPEPNNNLIKVREQLEAFRNVFRGLLNEIKKVHGQETVLHVFPAVPVSVAVEIGRVWMPKADMALKIYDQNRESGFQFVFDIPEVKGHKGK